MEEEDRSIPRHVVEAAARVRHWLRSEPAGTEVHGLIMASDRPRPGAGITEWEDTITVFVDHSVSVTFRSGVLTAIEVGGCNIWLRGVGVDPEVVEHALDRITADALYDLAARRKAIQAEDDYDEEEEARVEARALAEA